MKKGFSNITHFYLIENRPEDGCALWERLLNRETKELPTAFATRKRFNSYRTCKICTSNEIEVALGEATGTD
jgi:hypothetical protein